MEKLINIMEVHNIEIILCAELIKLQESRVLNMMQ